jgi:glycosyltransferase involved in cell wall biosynthesis
MLSFFITSLFSVFYLRKLKPNFLIAESPPLLTGLSGLILARCSGAKFILNISDIWPLSAVELGAINKGSFTFRILQSLERFLYRNSYACLGQSLEIVNHLAQEGAPRSWLFRNGVNTERFYKEFHKTYEKPLKIVYAGLLGVAQGILSLCRELKFDSSLFEIHLYGTGAELSAIESYLKSNPKKGIYLHQPLSRNDIPNMLHQYDLTLIPLVKPIYGAVPSKIYEAMAAGLPILFAGGGEGSEIVEKYKIGWICQPSDFKAMSITLDKIAQLTEDKLFKYRENCKFVSVEIFDRKIQINQLHKLLNQP